MKFTKQWTALMAVPGVVLMSWPAYFTFAAVRTISGMIINVIPQVGGYPGVVVNSAILGFSDVTKFATWDAVKSGC